MAISNLEVFVQAGGLGRVKACILHISSQGQKFRYFLFLVVIITVLTKRCQNMEQRSFYCIENEHRSYFIFWNSI